MSFVWQKIETEDSMEHEGIQCGGNIASLILNLGSKWMCMINFCPQPLSP